MGNRQRRRQRLEAEREARGVGVPGEQQEITLTPAYNEALPPRPDTPEARNQRQRVREILQDPQEKRIRFQGEDLIFSLRDRNKTLAALNKAAQLLNDFGRNNPTQELEDAMQALEKLMRHEFEDNDEVWRKFMPILCEYDAIWDEQRGIRPSNYGDELKKFLETDPSKLKGTLRAFKDMGEGRRVDGLRSNFQKNGWENRDFRRVARFHENLRYLENLRRGKKNEYQKAKSNLQELLRFFKQEILDDDLSTDAKEQYILNYLGYNCDDFEMLLQALDDTPQDAYVETRTPDEIEQAKKERSEFLEASGESLEDLSKALKEIEAGAQGKSSNQDTFTLWAQPDYEYVLRILKERRSILQLESFLTEDIATYCEEDAKSIGEKIKKLFIIAKHPPTDAPKLQRIITYAKSLLLKKIPEKILEKHTTGIRLRGAPPSLEAKVNFLLKIEYEKIPAAAQKLSDIFQGDSGRTINKALQDFGELKGTPDFVEPITATPPNLSPSVPSASPEPPQTPPVTPPRPTPNIPKTPEEQRNDDFRRLLDHHPLLPVFNQAVIDLAVERNDEDIKDRQKRLRKELESIAVIVDANDRQNALVTFLKNPYSHAAILRGLLK